MTAWRRIVSWLLRNEPDPAAVMPGHRRTYAGGPCHPLPVEQGGTVPPAWVTPDGCNVARLHAAYCGHAVLEGQGEGRSCAARVVKARGRAKRRQATVVQMRGVKWGAK
jgi:hypothetical protein